MCFKMKPILVNKIRGINANYNIDINLFYGILEYNINTMGIVYK